MGSYGLSRSPYGLALHWGSRHCLARGLDACLAAIPAHGTPPPRVPSTWVGCCALSLRQAFGARAVNAGLNGDVVRQTWPSLLICFHVPVRIARGDWQLILAPRSGLQPWTPLNPAATPLQEPVQRGGSHLQPGGHLDWSPGPRWRRCYSSKPL